jgi:hypothetical protein
MARTAYVHRALAGNWRRLYRAQRHWPADRLPEGLVQPQAALYARSTAMQWSGLCVAVDSVEYPLLWPVGWVEVGEDIVGEVVPGTQGGEFAVAVTETQ